MTAQELFDAIKAGDEALRQKVNRKVAEAYGWTEIITGSSRGAMYGRPPPKTRIRGCTASPITLTT